MTNLGTTDCYINWVIATDREVRDGTRNRESRFQAEPVERGEQRSRSPVDPVAPDAQGNRNLVAVPTNLRFPDREMNADRVREKGKDKAVVHTRESDRVNPKEKDAVAIDSARCSATAVALVVPVVQAMTQAEAVQAKGMHSLMDLPNPIVTRRGC